MVLGRNLKMPPADCFLSTQAGRNSLAGKGIGRIDADRYTGGRSWQSFVNTNDTGNIRDNPRNKRTDFGMMMMVIMPVLSGEIAKPKLNWP